VTERARSCRINLEEPIGASALKLARPSQSLSLASFLSEAAFSVRTRPARSNTPTCFIMPARVLSNFPARSVPRLPSRLKEGIGRLDGVAGWADVHAHLLHAGRGRLGASLERVCAGHAELDAGGV
jgi:hypothetical protein